MNRIRTRLGALVAALAATAAFAAIAAAPSQAYVNIAPGFDHFSVTPTNTQAGGHPDVSIEIEVRQDNETECESRCLFARRFMIHWPEGFIGNPHVAPKCTSTEFATQNCPVDSQIGKFALDFAGIEIYVPLYNLQTRPDQAGLIGFTAPLLTVPILFELSGRTDSDYGLDAISSPQVRLPFNIFRVTLWGVPAADEHDVDRFFTPLTGLGACPVFEGQPPGCGPGSPFGAETFAPATVPAAPFLQNPTTCGVPLTVIGEAEYYGGDVGRSEQPWPATTGCNQASFTPSIATKPTTTAAESAAGIDTKLKVPQTQSPVTPAPSELKSARTTLPAGYSLNPAAADGKVACPESLTSIGTLEAARCPDFSKIGTLLLDIAALPAPIPGALYLAEPKPGEPYRVLLTASGFATNVKLLGRVETDPATGQVTLIFDSLPQAPLQEFDLHVFGSERGVLATPSHCGVYGAESEFVPWNTALLTRFTNTTMNVDQGPNGAPCPNGARPFSPKIVAGVANNTAGRHSSFSFTLTRSDGEQDLTGVTVETPPGFAAKLKGVPYCPEAAMASLADRSYGEGIPEQLTPACPAASQIGTGVAAGGVGTHPLHLPGKVYLAGPYKGAQLSLFAVIPAVTGPYDLGNIVLRSAVRVNPVTAEVTTVSDPLPQIVEGVPVRTRSILINLDRPSFALNPTNCDPLSVDGTIAGNEGGSSRSSAHFQVANCGDLPFGPKLSIRLSGGLKRRGHPAIRAQLTAGQGEANIGRVSVTLPKGSLLDNSHIETICTRVDFAKEACPNGSLMGQAEAVSPLLDEPLTGPVYLRSSNNKLPDLVVDLEGQFDIELAGRIDAVGGRLRSTFQSVPDVPVSTFRLNLLGGDKGLLQNTESFCGKRKFATTRMTGQNGAVLNLRTRLRYSCAGDARRKRHHRGTGR